MIIKEQHTMNGIDEQMGTRQFQKEYKRERLKQTLESIATAAIIVAGIAIGSYQMGKETGKRIGKEEIVNTLIYERYDHSQQAKYANSLQEQEEILEVPGAITHVFDVLKYRGMLDDLSESVKEKVSPDQK